MVRKMSPEDRERFLTEPYVGVLSVAGEPGRAPLTAPIWYLYRPGGDITIVTSPTMRKTRLIGEAGRFALCVQATDPPYRYVTAEGPVVETRPVTDEERQQLADRYVGPARAAAYLQYTRVDMADYVAITMRPDRWDTADYSDVVEDLTSADAPTIT
jgi:hypothetical protein